MVINKQSTLFFCAILIMWCPIVILAGANNTLVNNNTALKRIIEKQQRQINQQSQDILSLKKTNNFCSRRL